MFLFYVIAIFLIGVVTIAIIRAVTSPLRSIPGPFLARFTRLWYFVRVANGKFDAENRALHRRYGPVVRLAPGMFSIDMPEAVPTIYRVGSKMPKSEWYDSWQKPGEHWSLFPDRVMKRHAEDRRRFQALYSMTSLLSYEGYADTCAEIMVQRFDEFADEGTVFDLLHWLQCYGFDVIGNITFSTRFGFLDRGEDVAGLIKALHDLVVYGALVGILPETHPVLYRVTEWLGIGGAAGRSYLLNFVRERVRERRAERAAAAASTEKPAASLGEASDQDKPKSFLDRMLDQNEQDPNKVTDNHISSMGLINVVAGADTTAITLTAIFYYLMRTPNALTKLREEVDEMCKDGKIDQSGHVRFQDAKNMPYLQAVITEGMRLHSVGGLPLWRDVAEGGVELGGQYFPEGTTVGVNGWCAHYNESVFGEDAHEFRPERWLVKDEDKLKQMNAYYLPFGLGSRACIGRHISILEMSKIVPLLVKKYDFEAVNGDAPWKTRNVWFVKPVDFRVMVKRRL
ncbi:hypothetical protein NHJ13051_003226 [Beauveria bassiana]